MEKLYKIVLACVCVALVFTLLGFRIGRMTDTAPATDGNQTINVGDTENETWDSNPKNNDDNTESEPKDNNPNINFDDTEIDGDGVEVRFQDGSVWTIIADPSVLGDDFDWDNYDFGMTDDHE